MNATNTQFGLSPILTTVTGLVVDKKVYFGNTWERGNQVPETSFIDTGQCIYAKSVAKTALRFFIFRDWAWYGKQWAWYEQDL